MGMQYVSGRTWVETQVHLSPRSKSYLNQINPKLYGDIAVVLLFFGGMFAFKFLSYELSMLRYPQQRKLLPQLCVAGAASHCLGLGSFFLLTWAGVYICRRSASRWCADQ